MPDTALNRVPVAIENVEVVVLESYPMQLQLNVTGYHDGCEFPVQVEQRREGNTVTVEIYREMPADTVCPMIAIPYEATIALEGGFESGTYTLHVNEYVTEIDL